MDKDKEEFKKRLTESLGDEFADEFFGALETPEAKEQFKQVSERIKVSADKAKKVNKQKTKIVYKVDLEPHLHGRTIIDENGDRVVLRKAKKKGGRIE
ncbi:hypothetical protein [Bacillus sp. TH008]|uniref:hypothetical protein n=1 Tax=Bacillus sp. TH008 TaxID=1609979 RepID=UPI00061746FD|nr:hypothetical protein [Bacillus sp. TH008]KKB71981.1 hypothetical protein TH62_20505 [Bacillus sp. TH008]